ncbi:hypothetical protein JCM31826_01310 [Thermaurantimonas aggregans]|uniref:Uncharacterized protein n=1 Tax=Thermaurantimonas aggregans TaxID=2173829 RepID=A0A401XI05_9FLAO|nr:hypothetical protein [Thermaurantimonas aggregans]GCD76649.1 hypothetical protein JCM31826_01310 [Thermaurantimonas aggregans]
MRVITTQVNQTIWDIALQHTGTIDSVFTILEANAFLRPDITLPEGIKILIPDTEINKQIKDYIEKNNIIPASGDMYTQIPLNEEDMIQIKQILNYEFSNGPGPMPAVRLSNLKGDVTIQINYDRVEELNNTIYLEHSIDGLHFVQIPETEIQLQPEENTHIYTLNILTNYLRVMLNNETSQGILKEIIYRV